MFLIIGFDIVCSFYSTFCYIIFVAITRTRFVLELMRSAFHIIFNSIRFNFNVYDNFLVSNIPQSGISVKFI